MVGDVRGRRFVLDKTKVFYVGVSILNVGTKTVHLVHPLGQ